MLFLFDLFISEVQASVAEWRKYKLLYIFSDLSLATELPIFMRQ